MTIPKFDDTPTSSDGGGEKRDPSEFVPWDRIAEVVTPRGTRPGLVMIVRPVDKIKDFRTKDPAEDWKTLVVADIAILDTIPPGQDQYGIPLPPIPAGSQWRNQLVFPGMLNKAWRDKIGGTLIGVVYMGQAARMPNGTMGKPPFLWRSLAQDAQQVQRGQGFMAARPEFLVPVPRVQQQPQHPVQDQWGQAPQQPQAPMQPDPWAHLGPQPTYAPPVQQQPQYQPGWQQDPNQQYPMQQPQYHQQPVQAAPAPQTAPPVPQVYQGGDPWNQAPAQAVVPAQAPPQQHPGQGMTTLDQLRQQAAQVNHQGAPQQGEPPF